MSVCVGGLPANTCGHFLTWASRTGIDPFRFFLLGGMDLCAKASMGLVLLSVPCTQGPAFRYWL